MLRRRATSAATAMWANVDRCQASSQEEIKILGATRNASFDVLRRVESTMLSVRTSTEISVPVSLREDLKFVTERFGVGWLSWLARKIASVRGPAEVLAACGSR